MKKDKEWLRREVLDNKFMGHTIHIDVLFELMDELDEPEVTELDALNRLAENVQFSAHEIASHLEKLSAYNGKVTYGDQEILVPKQDNPIVPTWFDKWWEDITKGGGSLFHNIERFYDELFSSGTRETYNYISVPDNKKKLLNIIVNELEYEVEEQKYYVLDSEDIPLLERANNQTCKTTTGLSIYEDGRDNYRFELTEQEIKDYDDRFWAFAEPVEEVEFRLTF